MDYHKAEVREIPTPDEIILRTLKKWPVNGEFLAAEIKEQLAEHGYKIAPDDCAKVPD